MKFCDIGVNLTNNRFRDDYQDVLAGALSEGVDTVIITGTNEQESAQAAAMSHNQGVALYSTAGVHPHDADKVTEQWLDNLEALFSQPNVVAVGECGLDFNRNFSSKEGQLAVFEAQLKLAKKWQMPTFLHERDAFEQQIALLSAHSIEHGVAHCFTGTKAQMQGYLELGLFIGITGWVCDPKRGQDLREAVLDLPLDRLLLETDAPYLLPKTLPKKIRRNEPRYISHVAQAVAEIKNISVEAVAEASYENAYALFRLRG